MKETIICLVLLLAGVILGWIIRWLYARFQLSASEQRAERVKQDAIKEAEAQKKRNFIRSERSTNSGTQSAGAGKPRTPQ